MSGLIKRRGLTGALLTQAEDAAQEFRRFEIVNPAVQAMKTCRFFLHIERHPNPTLIVRPAALEQPTGNVWVDEPKNRSLDLSKKWLKPSTGAGS